MTDISVKADKKTAIGVIQIFIGAILLLVFFIIAMLNRVWASITGDSVSTGTIFTLICIILGGFLIWKGFRNYKLASRYRRVFRIIGENTSVKLSTLEEKLEWSREKVIKAINSQIYNGYWKEPFIDEENGLFILGYKPSLLATNSDNKAINELLSKANSYIHDIISINRAITDDDLKNQVNTLVDIAKQTYGYVEKENEKASLVRQLTNYFLPTTVELLTSYLEVQNQTVKVESMTESMDKIKDMMNTIEPVYKKQLEAVYNDKALDVSVEIEVMKGIIEK